MSKRVDYWVEYGKMDGGWGFVQGSLGNRSFAEGYFHGLTSYAPRAAYRVMKGNWVSPKDAKITMDSPAQGGLTLA